MPARGFDGWLGSHVWLSIATLIGVIVIAQYLWTCRGLAGTAPSSTFGVAMYVVAVALYIQITRVALPNIPSTSRPDNPKNIACPGHFTLFSRASARREGQHSAA